MRLKTLLSVFNLESFRFSPSSKTIRLPANSLTRYRLITAAADSYCFGEHIFFLNGFALCVSVQIHCKLCLFIVRTMGAAFICVHSLHNKICEAYRNAGK